MENLNTPADPEQQRIAEDILRESPTAVLALPSGGCSRHVTSRTVTLITKTLAAPEFILDSTDPNLIRMVETGAMTLRIESPHTAHTLVLYGKLTRLDASSPQHHYQLTTQSARLIADSGQEWTLSIS